MKITILILGVLINGSLFAQDHALVNGGESPNKKYRVEVLGRSDEIGDPASFGVILAETGRIIKEANNVDIGGYYGFKAAQEPNSTSCLWNPDSKYVAVVWCPIKRFRDLYLARVTDQKVTWITPEDYSRRIVKELKFDSINRHEINTPSRWLSDTELVIDVKGDCRKGDDPITMEVKAFHYEVCIDVSTGKIKWIKQLSLKNEEG